MDGLQTVRGVNNNSASTHDDDERLEESYNLLHSGMPEPSEHASAKPRHLDVHDGEDGTKNASNNANQHRRREHDYVHWNRTSELNSPHRTVTMQSCSQSIKTQTQAAMPLFY